MQGFFGRHHIRTNFYMMVSSAYMIMMLLWSFSLISDGATVIIGFILFATDLLAELYDPHPDKPGKWFETHFHRVTDECPAYIVKAVFGIFMILIVLSVVVPTMYHEDGHCASRIIGSVVSECSEN